LPAFDRLAASAEASNPAGDVPLAAAASARLNQIHQQLQSLGAEYILLDVAEGGGSYRFHCRVQLEPQARNSRAFQAESADPLAAAEKVLAEVTNWRSAARGEEAGKLR
jgi:hypothetical protein